MQFRILKRYQCHKKVHAKKSQIELQKAVKVDEGSMPPKKKRRNPTLPGGKFYKCDICGKDDIITRSSYYGHMYRHKMADARKIYEKKCARCDEKFYSHIKLELHVENMHPATYTCDVSA